MQTDPGANNRKWAVLIENPMLPPYRLALFRGLSNSLKLEVAFSYGKARRGSALEDVDSDPTIRTLPVQNIYLGPKGSATIQMGLLRHLRSRKWDAMIASFDPRLIANLAALVQARRQGTRFIWWGHGVRPRRRFQPLYRWLALRADALILYSEEGRQRLIDLGVPERKLCVAWNSIDTNEVSQSAMHWDRCHRWRLLFIGRLIAEKKVDLLIKAFALASDQLPADTRLTIIGDGPMKEASKRLAVELAIDSKVEFVPAIFDQVALAEYFNTSLLSISPGAMGLSGIQSLAFGVPMVVADTEPHGPEIVAVRTGETGEYFTSGDASSLATLLVDLCSQPESLATMSANGLREVASKFSVDRMVRVFEEAVDFACGPAQD